MLGPYERQNIHYTKKTLKQLEIGRIAQVFKQVFFNRTEINGYKDQTLPVFCAVRVWVAASIVSLFLPAQGLVPTQNRDQ